MITSELPIKTFKPNQCIDPDGNVIKKGMSIVCRKETWVVTGIDCDMFGKILLVADKIMEDGRKKRLIVGHKRLRLVSVIGFQYPVITYP